MIVDKAVVGRGGTWRRGQNEKLRVVLGRWDAWMLRCGAVGDAALPSRQLKTDLDYHP